jgi:hypothetical protein
MEASPSVGSRGPPAFDFQIEPVNSYRFKWIRKQGDGYTRPDFRIALVPCLIVFPGPSRTFQAMR